MLTPLKAKLMSAIFSAMSSLHPADPNIDPQEAYCLAKNIYHEARSEGTAEQVMVATVTINMAKRRNRSICDEVYTPYRYSWTHASQDYRTIKLDKKAEWEAWKFAAQIAVLKLHGDPLGDTSNADHFYEYKSIEMPKSFRKMKPLARGENLVFLAENKERVAR